eukprot:1421579-Prymnesium_polylepis.1
MSESGPTLPPFVTHEPSGAEARDISTLWRLAREQGNGSPLLQEVTWMEEEWVRARCNDVVHPVARNPAVASLPLASPRPPVLPPLRRRPALRHPILRPAAPLPSAPYPSPRPPPPTSPRGAPPSASPSPPPASPPRPTAPATHTAHSRPPP